MAEIFRTPEKIKGGLEDIGVELPEGTGTFAIDVMLKILDIGATIYWSYYFGKCRMVRLARG